MSNLQRRFEILLPQRFNDGSTVPDELIGQTFLDLRKQFGSLSTETQIIRGIWEHAGQSYRDDLIRLFVDVADTSENQQFFRTYKELLKSKFGSQRILSKYTERSERS